MSEYDPIKELRDAGLLAATPESHAQEGHKANVALDVLSTLSAAEVEVLKSVRARMNEALEEEVGAHDAIVGGGLWWLALSQPARSTAKHRRQPSSAGLSKLISFQERRKPSGRL